MTKEELAKGLPQTPYPGRRPPRLQPEQRVLPITHPPRREREPTKSRSWVAFHLPHNLSYWFSAQFQRRNVNQKDVLRWPNDPPHVTVRWGLYTDQANKVADALNIRSSPVFAVVRFIGPQVFRNPDADVLVCRVESPQLFQYYRRLGMLPNEITHPDYNPHITIAYLRRGRGDLYQDVDFKIDPKRRFILRDLRFHSSKRSVALNK